MKRLFSLQGFMIELLLCTAVVSKDCDGPSAPQCFRRHRESTVYRCEWSTPFTHLHFINISGDTHPGKVLNWTEIPEEKLFQNTPVDIWVVPDGMPHCESPKIRVTLEDTIKYERPRDVLVRWSGDNLTLQWTAPEKFRAAVEIWHRADSSQTWNKIHRNTTAPKDNKYAITLVNLEKPSAQQLQLRHRSTEAKNPLWSDWAKILTVSIEFTRISKKLINTAMKLQRRLTLKWKPILNTDGEGVVYQVETQSFKGCRCHKHQGNTSRSYYRTTGSYSAVNISVRALNAASSSPPARFHVPPENPPDLKLCDGTALSSKRKRKGTCSEWYELGDGKVKEDTVMILTHDKKADTTRQKIQQELKEFLPYIYFEHQCIDDTPHTKKMCLYYKKQGKPVGRPQHLITSTESPDSATLSWEPISTEDQRGLITHYALCIQTVSSDAQPECRNISSSLRNYTLEGLTPSTKYNVSLMGVTAEGEGPKARVTINTPPEKPYNVGLSFGLLVSFFLLSITCTFIFTRIKNKVFPPVPIPVIPGFTNIQAEVQDLLERKEEVHKVTLVQLHLECCPAEDEEAEGRTPNRTRDTGSSHLEEEEEDEEEDRSSQTGSEDNEQTAKEPTEEELTDPERVQNEIALLIYRNGLVFDVNADSS